MFTNVLMFDIPSQIREKIWQIIVPLGVTNVFYFSVLNTISPDHLSQLNSLPPISQTFTDTLDSCLTEFPIKAGSPSLQRHILSNRTDGIIATLPFLYQDLLGCQKYIISFCLQPALLNSKNRFQNMLKCRGYEVCNLKKIYRFN